MLYIQHGQLPASGSFCVVHAALDVCDETGVCRQVAVKKLQEKRVLLNLPLRVFQHRPGRAEADGERVLRYCCDSFERERSLWSSLPPHPNIVQAIRADRIDAVPVLVLEYIHGPSLHEMIGSPAKPGLPYHFLDLLDLLHQGANALQFIHAKGIVHGDLLPQNILYDGLGSVVLADFGQCSRADSREPCPFLKALEPPEELKGGPPAACGDVWRLAVSIGCAWRGFGLGNEEALGTNPAYRMPRTLNDADLESKVAQWIGELPEADEKDGRLKSVLSSMLHPQPEKRIADGARLLSRFRREFEDSLEDLSRMKRYKRTLRFWVPTEAVGEALPEEITETHEKLIDLYKKYGKPGLSQSTLPDGDLLLALSAWRAQKGTGNAELLLKMMARHGGRSHQLYGQDPRSVWLIEQAESRLPPRDDRLSNLVRQIELRRKLLDQYGSFVHAHYLRESLKSLEGMSLPRQHKDLAGQCRRLLEEFDSGLLTHFKNLEKRLEEPI